MSDQYRDASDDEQSDEPTTGDPASARTAGERRTDGGTATELDEGVAARLATAFEFDRPPETVGEFTERMVAAYEASMGRSLGPDDLCTTDQSPHSARIGDEVRHYQCVLDALILGVVLDEPVTVETVTPVENRTVTVAFDGAGGVADLTAPSGAVLSYGVDRSVTAIEGPLTPEKAYPRLCGHSHVFASRAAYEEYEEADAVTQAWPLADGIEIARGMVAAAESTAVDGAGACTDCC